jgi:hypothetical protein
MDYDSVKRAEVELHDSASRRDRARVDALLHPDFVEIGRSGRLWSRAAMIDAIIAEEARPTPQADEWQFSEVSPGLVLVTYRLSRDGAPSRHSSLWDTTTTPPRVRFHQGTRIG